MTEKKINNFINSFKKEMYLYEVSKGSEITEEVVITDKEIQIYFKYNTSKITITLDKEFEL